MKCYLPSYTDQNNHLPLYSGAPPEAAAVLKNFRHNNGKVKLSTSSFFIPICMKALLKKHCVYILFFSCLMLLELACEMQTGLVTVGAWCFLVPRKFTPHQLPEDLKRN